MRFHNTRLFIQHLILYSKLSPRSTGRREACYYPALATLRSLLDPGAPGGGAAALAAAAAAAAGAAKPAAAGAVPGGAAAAAAGAQKGLPAADLAAFKSALLTVRAPASCRHYNVVWR